MLTLFCVVFAAFRTSLAETAPSVHLQGLGTVQGRSDKSENGRTILSFEGVPYARPPVSEYRFREPQPVQPWEDVWEAKTIHRCMQYNQYTPPGQDFVVGDEDCLYLNIYTPDLTPQKKFDVIVYIHGGSFMFNYGGLYRPQYLLDEDVVLVTINYRVGPLGFLSTEDDVVPGNNGLKDQIQALIFIKEHISLFGGNPTSVTIMGNSAGGASVHFHYLSTKSRGLFHRGLSLSGTMLVPWVLMEQPLQKTKLLSSSVGCDTTTTGAMVKCLRRRPARQILERVKEFQPWLYIPFSPFGVVVDTWAKDPVLPRHPFKLLESGNVSTVPWVASYTNSEGLYPAEEFYEHHLEDVATRWNELVPLILDYNYTVEAASRDVVSEKIKQHYLGNDTVSRATFRRFVPILSERLFVNDIHKAALLQGKVGTVYAYEFGYRGRNSWFMYEDGGHFGVAHADDVPYILKLKNLDTRSTPSDKEMSEFMVKFVVNFARTGDVGVAEWRPHSGTPLNYLKIEGPKKMVMEAGAPPNEEFWASLPIRENEKFASGEELRKI